MNASTPNFACAPYIKEIGRGARGARGLTRDEAHELYRAILQGRVSELELGAVLLAYRIKGESPAELAGMLSAVDATLSKPRAPEGRIPVVIPSYNGARRQPNLVALLALLLARAGTPVLIHGVLRDADRVTTAQVLGELGIAASADIADAERGLVARGVALVPTEVLSPSLAAQLALRTRLGVRSSAHTLAKLIQPFAQPALRLVNYTHPAYRDTLTEYFLEHGACGHPGVLLARGTEGEAVADPGLTRETLWLCDGRAQSVIAAAPRDEGAENATAPSRAPGPTAAWIKDILAGKIPVPAPIAAQVAAILDIVH